MKMGSVAVAVVMATMIMIGGVPQRTQAQRPAPGYDTISCYSQDEVSLTAAMILLEQMSLMTGECSQTNNYTLFTPVHTGGNARAGLSVALGFCLNCADLGNDLQKLVIHCAGQHSGSEELVGGYLNYIGLSRVVPTEAPSPSPAPAPSSGST